MSFYFTLSIQSGLQVRRYVRAALFVGLGALVPLGCGGAQDGASLSYGDNAKRAYLAAKQDMESGNCIQAEPEFRRIRRTFSYSGYAALAELGVADCQLKDGKYAEAIESYRHFVRFRPSHRRVPYARFRVAEAHFRQIPSGWLLSPPSYERDQGATNEALRQLRRFLIDFPDHRLSAKAREMSSKAVRILARHELYVARFYFDRGKPKATIGRVETLLNAYPRSGFGDEALWLLGRAHLKLNQPAEARAAWTELLSAYPKSQYSSRARSELSGLPETASAPARTPPSP